MSETHINLESNAPLAALESWLRGLIREEVRAASSQNGHHEGDRLLDAEEASKILSVSPDWLYRHGSRLPFTRKLAPRPCRRMLFSAGIHSVRVDGVITVKVLKRLIWPRRSYRNRSNEVVPVACASANASNSRPWCSGLVSGRKM